MSSTSPEKEKEVSAGIITFRCSSGKVEYLLLKHANGGHWSFPKGHLEEGEGTKEAALRELREETGLAVKSFSRGFEERTHYSFERDGLSVAKTVVYYLARAESGSSIELSAEHLDYRWLDYRSAREVVTYENDRQLLDAAAKKLAKGRSGKDEC